MAARRPVGLRIVDRPKTRGDCANIPRPCPFVGCKYNLFLDVNADGSLRFNRDCVEHMEKSCVLDVADQGAELSLREIGELLRVSFQRVLQTEQNAIKRFAKVTDKLKNDIAETGEYSSMHSDCIGHFLDHHVD